MGDARARGRLWVGVSALFALVLLSGPAAALPLVEDQALGSVVDTAAEAVGGVTDTVDATLDSTVDTVDGVTETVQGTVGGTVDALAPPAAPAAPEPPAVEPAPAVAEPVPPAPTTPGSPAVAESAPVPPPAPATAPAIAPPPSAPSAPSTPSPPAHESPDAGIIGPVVDRAGVPLALVLVVGIFLTVQSWIDRRDPKLALAPLEAAPDLVFPPGSVRA